MRWKILGLVAAAVLALTGCNDQREIQKRDIYIGELRAKIDDLNAQLRERDQRLATMPKLNTNQMANDLNGIAAVEARGGNIAIVMESDILFAPGSATLTSKARSNLKKVVSAIQREYESKDIRVEGHTDSTPLKRTKAKWGDNFNLSGARARSVLDELVKAGIPAEQLSFAGYAYHKPKSGGKSKSDLAKNRRVEILVITQ